MLYRLQLIYHVLIKVNVISSWYGVNLTGKYWWQQKASRCPLLWPVTSFLLLIVFKNIDWVFEISLFYLQIPKLVVALLPFLGVIGLNCEKSRKWRLWNAFSGFFSVCEWWLLHKVRQTASDQRLGIMHVMLTAFGIVS